MKRKCPIREFRFRETTYHYQSEWCPVHYSFHLAPRCGPKGLCTACLERKHTLASFIHKRMKEALSLDIETRYFK